jgi:hypothetical protein
MENFMELILYGGLITFSIGMLVGAFIMMTDFPEKKN